MRIAVLASLALWAGATLVLGEIRWFRRPALVDRLRPYVAGGVGSGRRGGGVSISSIRDVIGPLSRTAGAGLSELFGVREDLAAKLDRIRSPLDVTEFRIRQLGRMTLAMAGGGALSVALRPPWLIAAFLLLGSPLLTFLVLEQQVSSASADRQRRLFLELPVVTEQLAMLLSAGFSLGSALNRLAERGSGVCAEDLRGVVSRTRQGLTETEALREWAELARVQALDRLVPVLALNHEASDLGRLLSDEARSLRQDVHRELVEVMDRRSQSVWIPVTVATLVPGVIFLAIPFIEALRLFSGS